MVRSALSGQNGTGTGSFSSTPSPMKCQPCRHLTGRGNTMAIGWRYRVITQTLSSIPLYWPDSQLTGLDIMCQLFNDASNYIRSNIDIDSNFNCLIISYTPSLRNLLLSKAAPVNKFGHPNVKKRYGASNIYKGTLRSQIVTIYTAFLHLYVGQIRSIALSAWKSHLIKYIPNQRLILTTRVTRYKIRTQALEYFGLVKRLDNIFIDIAFAQAYERACTRSK